MAKLDFQLIDIDHHYYEPDDCCTRHLEPRFADRAVHIGEYEGERAWFMGDRPLGFDRRPLDWVLEPGDLRRMLPLRAAGLDADVKVMASTADAAFRDRDARIDRLDAFGVQACVMFSSFFFENEFPNDPEAGCANLRAYNRWVAEDWGWAYRDRLFAPATLSLIDVDFAVAELERVLTEGARLLLLRTGPVAGRSPADPVFDPFWARVEEAGVPAIFHVSLSTYETDFARLWGEPLDATMAEFTAFQWFTCFMHRPIIDTMASLVFNNLFGRFPGLRILSIENGSAWVPKLMSELDHVMHYTQPTTLWPGGKLTAKPSELLREHLFVSPFFEPYYEAPLRDLVDVLGIDRLVFGSDWPHGEGKPAPLDYLEDVADLTAGETRRFLRDNGLELLALS
jgi:predicted TIM-barrel fold metal-dependent hydrolase